MTACAENRVVETSAPTVVKDTSTTPYGRGITKTPKPVGAINKRVALIIGNATYKLFPLNNPVNDARDMAKALRSFGFKVIIKENASLDDMDDGLDEFKQHLGKGVVGLFYFSGHGIQIDGINYLIPVDLTKLDERYVKRNSIKANDVLSTMQDTKNSMNIVILDACRDNPFQSSSKGLKRGLARIEAPKGTLISYATSPGDTADDGSGRNSPYTAGLLSHISQPNLAIELLFKKVRNTVLQKTINGQTPWELSSLRGEDFYFNPVSTPPPPPPLPPPDDGRLAALKKAIAEARAEIQKVHDDADRARSEAATARQENARYIQEMQNSKGQSKEDLKIVIAKLQKQLEEAEKARKLAEKKLKVAEKKLKVALAELEKFVEGQPPKPPITKFQDILRDGSKAPEMVRLPPASSFKMGDIQGGNYQTQSVKAFAISTHEITFAQYDKFAEATGSFFNSKKPEDEAWGRGNRPVINVSFDDAVAYTKWLTKQTGKKYRLPTEIEWEYAARAGTETKYWWGNEIGTNKANCDGCGSRWDNIQTAPVGSFPANPFKLHDTVGNVWEWVSEKFGDYRVIRSGAWNLIGKYATSYYRDNNMPDNSNNYIGFRIVRQP